MQKAVASLFATALLLAASGCHIFGGLFHRPPPCVLSPAATKQEIVAHVNRNITPAGGVPPLTAWRCIGASLKFRGAPPIPATIDVEAPHRIRIRAQMPFTYSEVVDFGSNDQEVWMWEYRMPGVMTIPHEQLPEALAQMQIPFEPEWLMEVLGVVPVNVDDFELVVPSTPANYIELVANRSSPTGETVRRVLRIDLCRGQISEHRVESLDGRVIASAHLSNYGADAGGRYMLPHLIKIEWPETDSSMTLGIGDIIANPPPHGLVSWEVPEKAGVPRINFPGAGAVPRPQSWREPLLRQTGGEESSDAPARVRVPDLSEDAPPAVYSGAASRSSWDPLLREPESVPQPFPAPR